MRVVELLNTLNAPAYLERVALGDGKHNMRVRKAIRRAIRNQMEGKGFSLVEILEMSYNDVAEVHGDEPLRVLALEVRRRFVAERAYPEHWAENCFDPMARRLEDGTGSVALTDLGFERHERYSAEIHHYTSPNDNRLHGVVKAQWQSEGEKLKDDAFASFYFLCLCDRVKVESQKKQVVGRIYLNVPVTGKV